MSILEYLEKARRRVLRPGSRGGQYWLDKRGNVRYDEYPDLFSIMTVIDERKKREPRRQEPAPQPLDTPTGTPQSLIPGADARDEVGKKRRLASKQQTVYDVGEKIGGARKDLAEKFRATWSEAALIELEQADEATAVRMVQRDEILGKFDPEAYRERGVSPGAVYLIGKIYGMISVTPKRMVSKRTGEPPTLYTDSPFVDFVEGQSADDRLKYIRAIHRVTDALENCKTANEVWEAWFGIRNLPWRYVPPGLSPNNREDSKRIWETRRELELELGSLGKQFWSKIKPGTRKDIVRQWASQADFYDYKNDWSWTSKKAVERRKRQQTEKPWEREVPDEVRRTRDTRPVLRPDDFLSVFGMRAVEFGNWIDEDSGLYHVHRCGEALDDLADLLGVPREQISYGGRLALAFGARGQGRFSAHYETDKRVINLTKYRGGGSLAHEWGHFLDHIAYRVSYGDKPGQGNAYGFCSHGRLGPEVPDEVKQAWQEVMRAIFRGDYAKTEQYSGASYTSGPRRVFQAAGGNVGKAIQEFYELYPNTSYKQLKRVGDYFCYLARLAGQDVKTFAVPTGTSAYVEVAKDMGIYWKRPHELFARAFESYIEDKLAERGQKSTYLVTGTHSKPYPRGTERERINKAMDKLIDALKQTETLRKALLEW